MKKIVVLLSVVLSVGEGFAQDQRIWATYYGGANIEGVINPKGLNVTTDVSGNIYMAGVTQSDTGIAFNGIQNTIGGGSDAFLVKFDSTGNRLWATYYGGPANDMGHSVAIDADGNIYLAGETKSTSGIAYNGFDNTIANTNSDAFVVKFDPGGNRLWATYFGGTGDDYSYGVATDRTGNVYLAGSTSSTSGIAYLGFDNVIGGGSGVDGFVAKFDSSGNRIWATYYGGAFTDRFHCITTDNKGNIYAAGETDSGSGMSYEGFQNTLGGALDAFLVKFDSSGNRLWATYYGGYNSEYGFDVATDKYDNVYLAGEADSPNNIGSEGFQNVRPGLADAFLSKFDSLGNRLWGTYYGGPDYEIGFGVATDTSANVYLSGVAKSETDIASAGFQDTITSEYLNDFIVKFDTSGNRICATYYGGNTTTGGGNDYRNSIAADKFGNVYLAGIADRPSGIAYNGFQNSIGGDKDCYLVKFRSAKNMLASRIVSVTDNSCSNECAASAKVKPSNGVLPYTYVWSDLQTTQTANGLCVNSYNVTVTDAINNFASSTLSIGYLNPELDTSVTELGTALQANAQNVMYQWIDCDNNNSSINGATEQVFSPATGSYAVVISNGVCVFTSNCHQIISVEINENDLSKTITLYPNPATMQLTVELNSQYRTSNIECRIMNTMGQVVQHSIFDVQHSTFDISSLSPGLYYLHLQSAEGVAVKKFEVIR